MGCILFVNQKIAKYIQVWYDCRRLDIPILFDTCLNEITLFGIKMFVLIVMMATLLTTISDLI